MVDANSRLHSLLRPGLLFLNHGLGGTELGKFLEVLSALNPWERHVTVQHDISDGANAAVQTHV